jgi:hypothetical protein
MNTQFQNGWIGFTKTDFKKMYDTITNQWPTWVEYNGCDSPENAASTLRANGLHPDFIPDVFKDCIVIGKILQRVERHIPLTFIPTPL